MLWIGTGDTVQQTLQHLFFTLPAHGTRCFWGSRHREALLSTTHQRHPFLQLRVHRQPSCGSDGFDQAARVVIPAALAEGQHIPITQQGLQAFR